MSARRVPGGLALARPVRLVAFLAILLAPTVASAQAMRVDLPTPRVAITSAFKGADILVFGALDAPGDVVITVSGTPVRQTVLRKERILGLWVTGGRQTFDDVPTYYAVAATRPLSQILPPEGAPGVAVTLSERLASIKPVDPGRRRPDDMDRFRDGLVDAKRRELLYPAEVGPVNLVAGRLFRAELQFPSRLPVGDYEITAYVVREGQTVSAVSRPLIVSKEGFSAELFDAARDQIGRAHV